jgi:DNA-binding MarR family transcriptional regulator
MTVYTVNAKGAAPVSQPDIATQITETCLMGRTRYLARVLSGIYDEELRPFGAQASQITSLAVIARSGPVRRTDIGLWLHLDSSTLTRNVRVMLGNGWVEEVNDGEDGRGLPLRITPEGQALLARLGPAWRRAQARASALLGGKGQAAVMMLFDHLQDAAAD